MQYIIILKCVSGIVCACVCVFSPSIPDELLCAAEDKTILRDWFMTHTHTAGLPLEKSQWAEHTIRL